MLGWIDCGPEKNRLDYYKHPHCMRTDLFVSFASSASVGSCAPVDGS